MSSELIGIGIFLGIWLGIIGAFLLIKIKNNKQRKKLLKEIEKKRLKLTINGKSLESIEKEMEEKKEEKVEKKKPKVRVRKMKKEKKVKKKLKKKGSKKK